MSQYYIGCPVWACESWVGKIFPRGARRADWIKHYSRCFNTVEGNTTFYAMPTVETAKRWAEQADGGFRFALKFPRIISHEKQLMHSEVDTEQFLACLRILQAADCLGPSFLQLPPGFAANQFDLLEKYLRFLPSDLPFAVEPRHHDWFSEPFEQQLDDLLTELEIDRVIFDSRALFSQPPSDPIEKESQRRKPKSPIRQTVTGKHPFLRFVGRNDLDLVDPWIAEWAPVVAGWISKGLKPYIFTHSPDDAFAPEFAWNFHKQLQRILPSLDDLPQPLPNEPQQLGLF